MINITPASLLSEGSIVIYHGQIGVLVGNKPHCTPRIVTECGCSIWIAKGDGVELVKSAIELATDWLKKFSAMTHVNQMLQTERNVK